MITVAVRIGVNVTITAIAIVSGAMTSQRDRGLISLLTRLAKTAYRAVAEEQMGMTLRELVLLTYIDDHGGALQSELAEQMHLDANNLVLVLNGLEGDGLIQRRRDPADRRRHIVMITKAGVKAREAAELVLEEVQDEVFGALSQDERATLHDLLARALERATDQEGAALAGRR